MRATNEQVTRSGTQKAQVETKKKKRYIILCLNVNTESTDPWIGNGVAFLCGGTLGNDIIAMFDNPPPKGAKNFGLDSEPGHITGVIIGKPKNKTLNCYEIEWSFTKLKNH